MAVTVQDCLKPKGDLDPAVHWPKKKPHEIDTIVGAYLAEARVKADVLTVVVEPHADLDATKDAATKLWVNYRTFRSDYLQMVRRPSTVAFRDEGSKSTLVTQIQLMKDLMDEAEAAFDAIADAEEPEEDPVIVPPRSSHSARAHYEF